MSCRERLRNRLLRQELFSLFVGFIMFWLSICQAIEYKEIADRWFIGIIGVGFIIYSFYNLVCTVTNKDYKKITYND